MCLTLTIFDSTACWCHADGHEERYLYSSILCVMTDELLKLKPKIQRKWAHNLLPWSYFLKVTFTFEKGTNPTQKYFIIRLQLIMPIWLYFFVVIGISVSIVEKSQLKSNCNCVLSSFYLSDLKIELSKLNYTVLGMQRWMEAKTVSFEATDQNNWLLK